MSSPQPPTGTDPRSVRSPDAIWPFRIGSHWHQGDAEPLRSTHPGDASLVAVVARASLHDVDKAVATARTALQDSGWRQTRPAERAEVLRRIAEGIERDSETLAQWLMLDSGTPITRSRLIIEQAAHGFRYYAALCETWQDDVSNRGQTALSLTVADPWGVVTAITPAAAPLLAAVRKLAPALAAGNAILVKPSEQTPLPALELARIAGEAGLPEGILTVLPGDGPEIGAALVKHPDVRLVSFTGTALTGRAVATTAGNRLIPSVLSLEGDTPHIVFDDARFDEALDAVTGTIFEATGWPGSGGPRVFIHKPLLGRFLDALVQRAKSLKVGPPADPQTRVGPLVSGTHQARALKALDIARSEGARILVGGKAPVDETLAQGCYVLPTVIEGLSGNARLCREGGVGPVIVCLPFRDEADLVEQARASVHGLAASLWTADLERGWRVSRALDAGSIWLNAAGPPLWPMTVGGPPGGVGYEQGLPGLREYSRIRNVHLGLPEQRSTRDRHG